jgi:hypothetical protein
LRETIGRLLSLAPAPTPTEAKIMNTDVLAADLPQRVFDEGMEYWWAGDRSSACRRFKEVLKLDPHHADAHNHLGIRALDDGRLRLAEEHFRAAMEHAERHVQKEGRRLPWSALENRSYLRPLANLALLFRRKRLYAEAREIHERMLQLNPNDNQGVRVLLGEELYRLGEVSKAVALWKKNTEDPCCCFDLALVAHEQQRPAEDIGAAMLLAFGSNRYIAPMLLGEPWERLDAWHGTNMAEPEWAGDYVESHRDLWRRVNGSAAALRWWWKAPIVRSWEDQLEDLMIKLKSAPPLSQERLSLLARERELKSEEYLRVLAKRVTSAS